MNDMKTINDIIENVNEGKQPFCDICMELKKLGMSDEGCLFIERLIISTSDSTQGINGEELATVIKYVLESLKK